MIYHYSTVDSTNTLAFEMARQGGSHGTVIYADRQTGGKGRASRQFVSPAGGLYFSLIVKTECDTAVLPLVTLAAGVGLCTAIRGAVDVNVGLKWPNDLYVDGRKLGGILVESGPFRARSGPEFLIIGAGINVTTESEQFPSSLRSRVISLYHASEGEIEASDLLAPCVDAVLLAVQRLAGEQDQVLAEWRTLDLLQGRNLEYDSDKGMTSAVGIGLADDGRYVVRDREGKEHHVLAGDINPIGLTLG